MSPKNLTVLVTGGAGYVGSHTVVALKCSGYNVIVLDNLMYGHQDLIEKELEVELIVGDTGDRALLDHIFTTRSISAVLHFAAYAYVGESVSHPDKYYRNNVVNTLILLEAMLAASIKNFIFSSSCATYGIPNVVPIAEDHPQHPISPYGFSKLVVERMLADFDVAYNLKSVCFRYFNAAGADPDGLIGEDHNPETHLIPLAILTAMGIHKSIPILGTDFPTHDGTGIRDYTHVIDLATAHVLGLEYLLNGGHTNIFNLGNGNGFSVKEVIDTVEMITGQEVKVEICSRRPGDPPSLVSNSDKARKILGWQPKYPNLADMVSHAWQWHQKRHKQK